MQESSERLNLKCSSWEETIETYQHFTKKTQKTQYETLIGNPNSPLPDSKRGLLENAGKKEKMT